jgi:hypothetical protein
MERKGYQRLATEEVWVRATRPHNCRLNHFSSHLYF